MGLKHITEEYFSEHITKYGKDAYRWIMVYALTVFINLIFFGFPMFAALASLAAIFGRIIAFYSFSTVMRRIAFVTKLRVGGFIYLLYAFFGVIVAIIAQIAATAGDTQALILSIIFRGFFDSLIVIVLGIKIILDFTRIKNYMIANKVLPNYLRKPNLITQRG